MAIPTQAAFDASVKTLHKYHLGYLRPAFNLEMFQNEDPGVGLRLIEFALRSQQELHVESDADEVVSWLTSQDAYGRVMDKLLRLDSTDAGPLSPWFEGRAQEYSNRFRRIANLENVGRREMRFEQLIALLLGTSPRTFLNWQMGLIRALREYYYSDYASRIIENRRQLSGKIDRAIDGIMALKEIWLDGFASVQFHSMQNVPRAKRDGAESRVELAPSDLDRKMEILRAMKSIDPDKMYPLARQDGTMKERLFVFRMARYNFRCWNGNKPGVISGLMEIEGFKAQLDERNIEKQCAMFDRKERHLFEAYLAFYAVSENTKIMAI